MSKLQTPLNFLAGLACIVIAHMILPDAVWWGFSVVIGIVILVAAQWVFHKIQGQPKEAQ
ncbi:MAG: hypothetical protein HKN29_05035 [Rhodothermales bacterium]|nr:hypothetical protein [Rhodothermales bacterium]